MARHMERQKALGEGKATYFTGRPCKRGHISERFTSSWICIECSRTEHYTSDRERYRAMENTMALQFKARKQQSLNKGVPFTIELEDLEQPEYCPILGIKLNYAWGGKNGQLRDPAKATIDKVIPELGYVPGNVFIISWRANKLKSDVRIEELENILKYMKEKIND